MSAQVTVQEKNGTAQPSGAAQQATRPAFRTVAPAVDVFENADEILVVADVPGVANDGIDVRVENDTLTIATKRTAGRETRALAREYEEFDFARTFRLPGGIDGTAVRAETRNGTLLVRLPKAAAAKPRKVPVNAAS